MSKKCYLFGAGAEITFGASCGADFAKAVMGVSYKKDKVIEIKSAIKEYLKGIDKSDWYPSYKNKSWKIEDILRASIKKMILECNKSFTTKKAYEDMVNEEIKKIKKEKKKNEIINDYPSYMGLLDEKFHTLIAPKALGPGKFWNVISCYYRAYLLLVSQILYGDKPLSLEKYTEILSDHKATYLSVIQKCQEQTSITSYYNILNEIEKGNSKIITTNYTPYAQYSANNGSNNNIAYLHGRFGLFESPKLLQVYDVEKDTLPDDLVFPYIFIQSGVKPIVDITQMNEYRKMLNMLDESDELIVVGFKFNKDDNHINSFVKNFVMKKDKRITYLDFNGENGNYADKLQLNDELKRKCDYIPISKENCYEKFKKCVQTQ